jgi:hypothetical protein
MVYSVSVLASDNISVEKINAILALAIWDPASVQENRIIYTIDPDELTVPQYVAEGLEWLQTILRPEEC